MALYLFTVAARPSMSALNTSGPPCLAAEVTAFSRFVTACAANRASASAVECPALRDQLAHVTAQVAELTRAVAQPPTYTQPAAQTAAATRGEARKKFSQASSRASASPADSSVRAAGVSARPL